MKSFTIEHFKDFIIDPTNVDENPVKQFKKWYDEYLAKNPSEPSAMFLATSDKSGIPTGRVVLLKAFDGRGFVFYTNYESKKARDLEENPVASLTFYWEPLHRQVRIFGQVEKVSDEESDAYFNSRPLESRLGAWASKQGAAIDTRDELIKKMELIQKKFGTEVPRPSTWGGFRVVPERFEFWQGRDNRIHDRVEYILIEETWTRQRLSP